MYLSGKEFKLTQSMIELKKKYNFLNKRINRHYTNISQDLIKKKKSQSI